MSDSKSDRQIWYWGVYLTSEHWNRFRRSYFDHHGSVRCGVCSRPDGLQLHHTTYQSLGNESFEDVRPLCEQCHAAVHVLLTEKGLKVEDTAKAIYALKYTIKPFVPKLKGMVKKKGRSARTKRQRLRLAYEEAMRKEGKKPGGREESKKWAARNRNKVK